MRPEILLTLILIPQAFTGHDWGDILMPSMVEQWKSLEHWNLAFRHANASPWNWMRTFDSFNKPQKSSESESESQEYKHRNRAKKDPNNGDPPEESPLVAQAFLFYLSNFKCSNVTQFQEFFVKYNDAAAGDSAMLLNDQHELLKEISELAKSELENVSIKKETSI